MFTPPRRPALQILGTVCLVIAAVVLAAGVGWLAALGLPFEASRTLVLIGVFAGVLGFVVRSIPPKDLAVQAELSVIADLLASRVAERANRDFTHLIDSGQVIDVTIERWRLPGSPAEDPDGMRMETIGVDYLAARSGRLVVVGSGGSGKTVLLLKLALDLARARSVDGTIPVPIPLSLATWDSKTTPVDTWLAQEIVKLGFSAAAATRLVASGLVLPLLDGLDEMDGWLDRESVRQWRSAQAIRDLDETRWIGRPMPFVLTCRDDVYERLVAAGLQVRDAFTGRVTDVTESEVFAFLGDSRLASDLWQPVFEALSDPASDIAPHLATPWHLSIIRRLAESADDSDRLDPARLVDDLRTPDGLLPRYATSLLRRAARKEYANDGTRQRAEPDERIRARLERSLRAIAAYLAKNSAGQRTVGERLLPRVEFVIHQLWPLAGNRARIVGGLISLAIWVPAIWGAKTVLGHSAMRHPAQVGLMALVGLFAVLSLYRNSLDWPHPRKIQWSRIRTRFGRRRLIGSAMVAVMLWLVVAALGEPAFGIGLAVGYFFSFGVGACLGVRDSVAESGPLVGLGAAVALLLSLATWATVGQRGTEIGIVAGLGVGGVALVVAVPVVLRRTGAPSGYIANPVFKSFIFYDAQIGLVAGGFAGVAVALLVVSKYGLDLPLGQAVGLGLLAVVAIGFGSVAEAWRRHVALLLVTRGALGVFLDPALAKAYQAGLLRRSGIAYQFRHAELRDYFAGLTRATASR